MAKKTKKDYQLKKGSGHNFDISKGSKRRFDLSKDDEDTVVSKAETPTPKPVTPKPSQTEVEQIVDEPIVNVEPQRKKYLWMWIVLACIVIALLFCWILGAFDKKVSEESVTEPTATEQTVDSAATTEEPAGEASGAEATENETALPQAGNTASGTSNAPSQPEASIPTQAQGATTVNEPALQTESTIPVSTPSADIEAESDKVIQGMYGNGKQRRNALGSKYRAVQRRVNEKIKNR